MARKGHNLEAVEQVEFNDLAAVREWLTKHHARTASIWAVTWKLGSKWYLPYGDLRDEALCWGWIDSLPRKLDQARTMHLLSPRRPGSAWSAINKSRAKALIADGRMKPQGLAAIERSKLDGGWSALDGVNTSKPPADLVRALASAKAAEAFAGFPPSSRRAILEWISLAKAPETRARRIETTARLAASGLRANHPESKGR
jgi:uncharacterized protein YdeI (YjbR/CyaY-like superfamily)